MSRRLRGSGRIELAAADAPVPRQAHRSRIVPLVAALATALYALFFGWLSLGEYWAYEMHALDMGNMGQAVWNTLHGHPFAFTNMRLQYAIEAWNTMTRLSFHVEALFPLLALAYVVYPHPESLLILQTLAIAMGAVPVYLLARDVLTSQAMALVFAVAYLLYPTVEALNLYEFHPVAFATPLLLFAFWFAHGRRYVPFVLCCLAAMGTKEQIGLVVAMFGLYVAFVQGERRIGLAVAAVGIGWSLFAALIVEKHFRTSPTVTYVASRYGYLCGGSDTSGQVHCHGFRGPIHTVLHDPGSIVRAIFVWPKLGYLRYLLAPTGYTAILAPLALLLALPTLALNLLSADSHMYSGVGDNSAEIAAAVMIAGILGAKRLRDLLSLRLSTRRASLCIGIYVIAVALWNQHVSGFTPLGASFHRPSETAHDEVVNRFVAMVPQSTPISTQDQLDPHLSSRRYLYLFLDIGSDPPLRPSRFVLLDVSAPTYPLPSYQLHDRALELLHRGWGIQAAQNGLILLRKGAPSARIPRRFYTFATADGVQPAHRLAVRTGTLEALGYDATRTDLANHRTPNIAFSVYFRAGGVVHTDLQPVIYESMGNSLVGCSSAALGLAWFPTSQWKAGHEYVVRLPPLETNWSMPGRLTFTLEIRPMIRDIGKGLPTCSALWAKHGRLSRVGSIHTVF